MKHLFLTLFLLALGTAGAHAQFQRPGCNGTGFCSPIVSASAAYQGPGDLSLGSATVWGGLRAYKASYATGGNPGMTVCDAATRVTCSVINILSNGYIDRATAVASAACAVSCVATILNDQTGNGHNFVSIGTTNIPIVLFSGCPSSSSPAGNICLEFVAASNSTLNTTNTVTLAQPMTFAAVSERYAGFTAIAGILNAASGPELYYAGSTNTLQVYAGNANVAGTSSDSALHGVQGVMNGASCAVYSDGSSIATGNCGTNGISAKVITLGDDANGGHSSIYVYEAGAWPSAFTSGNATTMNTNMHSATSGWNF